MLPKEQSVLISVIEEENMQFHDYKLAIEVDKTGHKDRNISHEIERWKAIYLGYKFIRINPDEKKAVNEI